MKKNNLLLVALIVSMATCSQTGGRKAQAGDQSAFEVKHSILFADGSLDEYIMSNWNSAFTHKDNETRYSASGTMIEKVEYTYHRSKGYVTAKTTRDIEGQLKNRVDYKYEGDNLFQENLMDSKNRMISGYEYTYDNNKNRISRIIKNRSGARLAETIYTYDDQAAGWFTSENPRGKMISSETRDLSDSVISFTQYVYDAQGNRIKQTVLDSDKNPTTVINTTWQGGNETSSETRTADGTLQMRVTNEYGSNGELVRKTIENLQGDSKQIMQYEYIFRPRR